MLDPAGGAPDEGVVAPVAGVGVQGHEVGDDDGVGWYLDSLLVDL